MLKYEGRESLVGFSIEWISYTLLANFFSAKC